MPNAIQRLVTVTANDIDNGQAIVDAVRRCWPEAKYVGVHRGELGINFAMDNPAPHQECLYILLPTHVYCWQRTWLRHRDNPDEKIKVDPIVFGMCIDESFLKKRHIDRISNDTTTRPTITEVA